MTTPARKSLWFLVVASLVGSVSAARAQSAGDSTRVTDPEMLSRMGFPPDAKHVFAAPGALVSQKGTRGTSPKEFGISSAGWSTELGTFAHPRNSSIYSSPEGIGDISPVSGDTFYDLEMHMPSGADFQGVRWWGYDGDAANNLAFFLYKVCQPAFSEGPPMSTILGQSDPATSGTPGNDSAFIGVVAQETVDNQSCGYWVRVRFDGYGSTLELQKIRAQWVRQVSPAPGVATFSDVPTTSPQFQFVEALVAAGITAGCGGGNFCPDQPITRGQMAVFLSAALGLHWAN